MAMLVVLTYDNPHKKTYDVLCQMKARGHNDVLVLATPWESKKSFTPLYPHRPSSTLPVHPRDMSERFGYKYVVKPVDEQTDFIREENPEMVIISGTGILPEELLLVRPTLNSHPGYLPMVRGLDALKWAIYDDLPVGVTAHIATAEADAGPVIAKELVPLYFWDTFHSFAFRQYDMEIRMLVDAIEQFRSGVTPEPIDVTGYPVHRRMPHSFETRLMERFAARRAKAEIEYQL